jgi:hypothetical protein
MPVADDTVKTFNPLAHSRRALLRISLLVEGGMFVAALVIGLLAGVPLWEGASVGWSSVSMGMAAGLALLAAAATITESNLPFAVQMRRDIDRLLILFRGATLADFLVISILAGLGEEALFRGLLQTGLAGVLGVPLAIGLAAIAFGFAHFISNAYVMFAAVLGVFFGMLQAWSGNIVVPMIAHATYDFVALCFVYRGRVPGGRM